MRHLGALRRISPKEEAHALVLRIAEEISKDAAEQTLLTWRHTLLTTSFVFKATRCFDDTTRPITP